MHPIRTATITAATIVGAWAVLAPTEPRVVQMTATDDPTVMAEQTVDQKVADLTAGRDCYQDPTGHQPTTAVVKVDGTTTVKRMTADAAWTAAHEGRVWIQAWCK